VREVVDRDDAQLLVAADRDDVADRTRSERQSIWEAVSE
jgi:hypothetical protein